MPWPRALKTSATCVSRDVSASCISSDHRSSSLSGPSGTRNASSTTSPIRALAQRALARGWARSLLPVREPEPSLDRSRHRPVPLRRVRGPRRTAARGGRTTAPAGRRTVTRRDVGARSGPAARPACSRTEAADRGRAPPRRLRPEQAAEAVISSSGTDHCCQRRPPSWDAASTAMPSSPPSMRGREPDPTTCPRR